MTRLSLHTLITCLLLSSTAFRPTSSKTTSSISPVTDAQESTAESAWFTKNVSKHKGHKTAVPTTVTPNPTSSGTESSIPTSPSHTEWFQSTEETTVTQTDTTDSTASTSTSTTDPQTTSSDDTTSSTITTPTTSSTITTPTTSSTITTPTTSSTITTPTTSSVASQTTDGNDATSSAPVPITSSTDTTSKTSPTKTTISSTTVVQQGHKPRALSSGSIAAIVCMFILMVIVVLGGLYYHKFKRESYGPLLESSDYGTLGNFNNPMYDP